MRIVLRLFSYLRPHWAVATVALVCSLTSGFLRLGPPEVARMFVDRVYAQHQRHLILPLVAALIGIGIVRSVLLVGEIYYSEVAAQRWLYDLRRRVYAHLQRLPLSFHSRWPTGQLMSRVSGDVDQLGRFLSFGAILLIGNLIVFGFVAARCFVANWRLTLISLATVPFLGLLAWQFGLRVQPLYALVRQRVADLTMVMQENIAGARVVRTYCREDFETGKFDQHAHSILGGTLGFAKLEAVGFRAMELLVGLSLAAVLYFGGMQVITNPAMTLGELIQFWMLVGQLVWPVQMSAYCVSIYYQTQVSGRRVFELLDAQPDLVDGTAELERPAGRVELEEVSFGYEGETTLDGVSLTVEPGMTVALLGATGSGKTTLVNLIPRFYDPTAGRVLLDGADLRTLRLDALRRHVGMVLQETYLFSATLAENIGYGRSDASRDEIEAAARAAALGEFVASLPEGLDTHVGERGVTLSGGQRQRVAIARTLLMDPAVLILDDSTSSVDTETEARIQAALQELKRGRTTFIIAQRLSSVKTADLIVVMQGGRIAEQGTHAELLARGGLYADIHELQLAGQEEPQPAGSAGR